MELRALPCFPLLKYKVPTFKFKQFSASKGGAELGVQGGGGAQTLHTLLICMWRSPYAYT